MNNLKEFYKAAEKREEIKNALREENEKIKAEKNLSEKEVKERIKALGKKFGYDITDGEFEPQEGEIDEADVAKVAGGISAGCFLSNAGCTIIGEIDSSGGCILLGLY